jgi:O-antigen/teichoic acid export membrane protein
MSRLKNFTRSLVSGYAQIAVNVIYTLASVPLALHYLSKAEFGLWALTLQIANFIALIDLGMSGSVARILIDHKDDRHNGRYGGAVKSGFLVGAAQGLAVLIIGLSLVWFLGGWLRLQMELRPDFFWLMIGQVLLAAATFATRIFGQILYAWQRIDISNYAAIVQLAVGFGVLWIGFFFGLGIFSLLAGAFVSWVCGVVINSLACFKLNFWPKAGEWGRASREQFGELFHYGASIFFIGIGLQLIASSQTILISRQLGVEAAALWSVMTKVFTLVNQLIWKAINNAMPAFAEMLARKEIDRLWNRYGDLFITTNVFSGVVAVLFAACNRTFVTIWTHGKFSWPAIDDVLLALWLILTMQQCCHISLLICFKKIGRLKYIYPAEGIVFVAVSLFMLRWFGIKGMLACSLLATLLFTWNAGTWSVGKMLESRWKVLLWDWQKPLLCVLMAMVPVWLILAWALHDASNWVRFITNGVMLAIVGGWVAVRYALPSGIVTEIFWKLPLPLRRLTEKFNDACKAI